MNTETKIGFKQFRMDGCNSFILYDLSSKEALIIDPKLDVIEDYSEYILQLGLRPVVVIDSHIHADHFSASCFFRDQYGCDIAMASATSSLRPNKKLIQGDFVSVGAVELKVMETPGHTPDSLSFSGRGMVFTGDTLFIGSSGRTDFPGASALMQWESIHRSIGSLPSDTIVMPGHDYSGFTFSLLGVEKEKNPHWMPNDKDKFVAMKNSEILATAGLGIQEMLDFNRQARPSSKVAVGGGCATACGVPVKDVGRVKSMNVDAFQKVLVADSAGSGALFIDVREPGEFVAGHIPGTVNIPLSELSLRVSEFSRQSTIYFTCGSGSRSALAAKTFDYLNFADVYNISGGFRSWVIQRLPVG